METCVQVEGMEKGKRKYLDNYSDHMVIIDDFNILGGAIHDSSDRTHKVNYYYFSL